MIRLQDPSRLDMAAFVRPGDTVVVGQGCAEPLTLTRALVAQRAAYRGARVLLCTVISDTFSPEHADALRFAATGIASGSRGLAASGVVDVIPVHYGDIERLIDDGTLPVDVVLAQVSPPDERGRCSLGAGHDYLASAIPRARVAIAEVAHRAPRTRGDASFALEDFDAVIETDRPLVPVRWPPPGEVEQRIGDHVAALVPDRATLQLGIGAIPDAVLARLGDRSGLGFHAGMISDRVVDLIEAGVIDNAHKGIDVGCSVTGLLLGTERLFRFADRNPRLLARRPSYTHSLETLARVQRLFSINSAIEVDLSGQVNAEALGSRYIGAIGGQVDFVRGTRASPGGVSVIALPSTIGEARRSRIVARLDGPVTTARSDVDAVVTEWGVARLRGLTMAQRAAAMIAIADPAHRESLASAPIAGAPRGRP